MSFLNASHKTFCTSTLAPHVTKAQVLSLLHDNDRMIRMSPIVISHTRLPDASSIAFFKNEAAEYKPGPDEAPIPVYEVVESMAGTPEGETGNWRGGWAKRFIPETLTYQTSQHAKEDGMVAITHAPMGVTSVSTWTIREEAGKLILDEMGYCTSNRMLMSFIKTTLHESHEELVRTVVAILEKRAPDEDAASIKEPVPTDL